MKQLILVRHSKSSKAIPELKDIDRPLTETGYHHAHLVAKHLKKQKVKADVMITSHAVRAITTALIFAQELKYPYKEIQIDENIYSEKYEVFLEVIKKLKDKYRSVMIFGHNPSMENLVNFLSSEKIEELNTTGVIGFDINDDLFAKGKLKIKLQASPKSLIK